MTEGSTLTALDDLRRLEEQRVANLATEQSLAQTLTQRLEEETREAAGLRTRLARRETELAESRGLLRRREDSLKVEKSLSLALERELALALAEARVGQRQAAFRLGVHLPWAAGCFALLLLLLLRPATHRVETVEVAPAPSPSSSQPGGLTYPGSARPANKPTAILAAQPDATPRPVPKLSRPAGKPTAKPAAKPEIIATDCIDQGPLCGLPVD